MGMTAKEYMQCDGRRGHLAGRDGTHVLFGEAGWCWKDSEEAAGSGDDDHHGGGDENCPASNAYVQGGQVEEGDGIAEKNGACNTRKTDNWNTSPNSWKIWFMIQLP